MKISPFWLRKLLLVFLLLMGFICQLHAQVTLITPEGKRIFRFGMKTDGTSVDTNVLKKLSLPDVKKTTQSAVANKSVAQGDLLRYGREQIYGNSFPAVNMTEFYTVTNNAGFGEGSITWDVIPSSSSCFVAKYSNVPQQMSAISTDEKLLKRFPGEGEGRTIGLFFYSGCEGDSVQVIVTFHSYYGLGDKQIAETFLYVSGGCSVPVISANASELCDASTTVLQTTDGRSVYWYRDNFKIKELLNPGVPASSIVVGPGSYYAVDPNCASQGSSNTVNIQWKEKPGIPATPSITASATVLCSEKNATLTASGGNGKYLWSTGSTANSIEVRSGATYWLRCMPNSNECGESDYSAKTEITISAQSTLEPPSAPQLAVSKLSLCANETTTLTATGGSGNYEWSTGQTGSSINVGNGTYWVRSIGYTNDCGYSGPSEKVYTEIGLISIPSAPSIPTVSAGKTLLCNGESTVLTASGGNGSYVWSTGETGSSISVSSQGNYYVYSPGNSNSCGSSSASGLAYIYITTSTTPSAPSIPTVSAVKTLLCNGESTVLTASGGNGSYVWSTGETGSSISVSSQGNYYVYSPGNSNSCGSSSASGLAYIYITTSATPSAPSTPTVSAGKTLLCNGETTLLTASAGNGNYVWSTGETGSSIRVSAAGGYWVQSAPNTNSCGSSAPSPRATIEIATGNTPSAPSAPTVSAGKTLLCNGETTLLTASGGNGSYIWSTGETGSSIRVSTAGSYWVQSAPNTNSCGSSAPSPRATIDIATGNTPSAPSAPTVSAGKTLLCNGETTLLTASGGNGSYIWSTGETGSSIGVSAAGSYWVQSAPNTNSCGTSAPSARASIEIATGNTPSAPSAPTVSAGKTLLCNGESTLLTATGGNGNYIWSTGETGSSIRVSTAGSYWVQSAPNTNSCGSSAPSPRATIDIATDNTPSAPSTPTLRAGKTLLCNGESTILTASGGNGIYLWTIGEWTGRGSSNIIVSGIGTYYVHSPGNTNSCGTSAPSARASIEIAGGNTPLAPPTPTVSAGKTVLCNGETTLLTASGGNGNYVWSTGETGSSIGVSAAGSYWVQSAPNTNSCGTSAPSARASIEIATGNTPSAPSAPTVSAGKTLLCNGESTLLTATGGNGNYIWSTGETGSSIRVSTAGSYWVQSAPNTNSCGSSAPSPRATIDIATDNTPSAPSTPTLRAGKTLLCNGESTILTASGGNGIYLWTIGESTGGGGSDIIVAGIGTYYVHSPGNTNSCGTSAPSARASIEIARASTPPAPSTPTVSAGKTILCNGETTVLTASGGNGSYIWSTGETSTSITVSTTGSYWVQSIPNTNSCGNSASSAMQKIDIVAAVTPKAPVITADRELLCPGQSASLSATFNEGIQIVWYKQGSSDKLAEMPVYNASQAGTYYAIASDKGCNSQPGNEISLTTGALPPIPEITGVSSRCVGEKGQMGASVAGGIWASSNNNILAISQSGEITGIRAGTSTVSYSVHNTCGVSTKNITVQVIALPSLAVITGASSICRGTSTIYKSSVAGGVWSSSNTTIVSVNPSNGQVTAVADGEAELRYTVTNASGCKSTSAFSISVITCALKGGVITPAEVSIVAGSLPGSFVLTGVSGGNNAYAYQWEVSTDSSKWTAITGANAVSYRPTAGVTKKTWYRVKVTSMDLTAYSTTATVKMLVALVAGPVTPAFSNVYRNTPVPILNVSPKGGTGVYTYEWQQSPDGKVWTTIRGAITQQYTPLRQLAVTYYRVIVRSGTQISVSGTGVIWFSGGDCISMRNKPHRVYPKTVIAQLYLGREWS